MLEHHIQKDIVKRLSTTDALRFSELKPEDLENKLFDYHLKLLIRDKLVDKNDDSEYRLTAFGRKISISAGGKLSDRVDRAFSVLFLIVRDDQNRWLLYKRLTHPLIGKVGFMHARPTAHQTITETASAVLLEKTSLSAEFLVRAHGYFRVFEGDSLESFTHFTILVAKTVSGELLPKDEQAEYAWHDSPNFTNADMLPNMADIVELCTDDSRNYLEKTYHI